VQQVDLTPEGRVDPLMQGLPDRQTCLQWHGVRVAQPPEGATVLARSQNTSVEAMRVGSNAWSMQYHVEIEPDTVANWAEVPAYHLALINSLGDQGYEQMSRDADKYMDAFLTCAERIYRNFISEISPG
jgi:GMP synthase-like glutamine amidotransferase